MVDEPTWSYQTSVQTICQQWTIGVHRRCLEYERWGYYPLPVDNRSIHMGFEVNIFHLEDWNRIPVIKTITYIRLLPVHPWTHQSGSQLNWSLERDFWNEWWYKKQFPINVSITKNTLALFCLSVYISERKI